jgi:hypothetical protein
MLGHRDTMSEQNGDFEQAAQIVEAFSESETDERILELLASNCWRGSQPRSAIKQ